MVQKEAAESLKSVTDEDNQEMEKELSSLKLEVSKGKYHANQYDKGMISMTEHKNTIQELREKWAEEIFFQKICWEKMQEELKELIKFKFMQKEKEQMLTLTQDLLSCRAPSPSYHVFLLEHMTLFKIKDLKKGRPWKIVTPPSSWRLSPRVNFQSKIYCVNCTCRRWLV